jgi:hypothetical protein
MIRRRTSLVLFLAVVAALLLLAAAAPLAPGMAVRALRRVVPNGAPRLLATPSLPEAFRKAGVPYPPPQPRVEIARAVRVLRLYSGSRLVAEYPVGLGFAPDGDKEREGDGRTPTGTFYICTRLERSRFHRFLGLSYPAPDDAERGLSAGLVSRDEHRSILAAHRAGRQPPWNTRLGGAVGIHGGGSGRDWTLGCIALENEIVEELFAVLPLGTPVQIR